MTSIAKMSSVVSAISGSCGLVAVYSPTTTSVSPGSSLQRLVVKCYDSKVSLGALKFTLVANISSSDESKTKTQSQSQSQSQLQSQPLAVTQLFFCGAQDDYLIATLAATKNGDGTSNTFPVVVWDLKRGVVCHKIEVPKGSILCTANGGRRQPHLYMLLKNVDSSKLIVNVHNLTNDSAKLIKQIKIGPSHSQNDDITFGMALHENKHLVVVQYGKRIKISPLTKGQDNKAVKWKIKHTAAITAATTVNDNSQADIYRHNHIKFSDDATFVILEHSNRIHFYSAADGDLKGSAPLRSSLDPLQDFMPCCLQVQTVQNVQNDNAMLIVLTGQPAGTSSLFHVHPQTVNDDITHFATLTPSNSASLANDANAGNDGKGSNKFLHSVYIPQGKRGTNNLLLLELTPRGKLGDVKVHLSELQYRSTTEDQPLQGADQTNSPLLQGELYPNDRSKNTDDDNKADAQSKKKRKMGNIALGPGEGGTEAMNVTDSATLLKKRKSNDGSSNSNDDDRDSNDEFAFLNLTDEKDGNKEAGDGTTIAERLALLSSQLDRDDDDGTTDKNKTTTTMVNATKPTTTKPVTSDSLLTLLRQALLSNDDAQLEVALQVSDRRMISNSVDALCAESVLQTHKDGGANPVVTLLSKLTARLGRRAGRAEALGFWVSATLLALVAPSAPLEDGGAEGVRGSALLEMGRTQVEVARHLGPLRNMLSEGGESAVVVEVGGEVGAVGEAYLRVGADWCGCGVSACD